MADIDASEPALWNEIKELEQREANAMLRADVSELDLLWADDLLVNSTANLIADKKILLAIIREGRLRLRSLQPTDTEGSDQWRYTRHHGK